VQPALDHGIAANTHHHHVRTDGLTTASTLYMLSFFTSSTGRPTAQATCSIRFSITTMPCTRVDVRQPAECAVVQIQM
jgi:hypothetical protein